MRNLFRAAGGILAMLLVACAAVPPVQAQVSNQAYSQTGDASLSVSNSSTRVALGSNESTAHVASVAIITNRGSNDAHIALGGSTVTAAVTDYLVRAGEWRQVMIGAQTFIAAITDSGTTTLDISTGIGSQLGGGGGSATIGAPLGSQPAASSVSVAVASDQVLNVGGSVVASGALAITGQSTTCTKVKAVNQTTSTDLLTAVAKLHICSIVLISASQQNLSLTEGTGSVCATGAAALIGGTTASVAVAANGGIAPTATAPWLDMQTAADHLCLLQSGVGNVSGIITYVDN